MFLSFEEFRLKKYKEPYLKKKFILLFFAPYNNFWNRIRLRIFVRQDVVA